MEIPAINLKVSLNILAKKKSVKMILLQFAVANLLCGFYFLEKQIIGKQWNVYGFLFYKSV